MTRQESASPSSRFIQDFLGRSQKRVTGLLLGQLDAFNRISSTFGELAAVRFCADYVERLRAVLPSGTPVIRLSERRFAVLSAVDSVGEVMEAAARLTEDDRARVQVGEDALVVDLTLGIAVYPTHAEDAASLFRRAELALKDAREKEVAFAMYSPDATRRQAALWKLESDFERAVKSRELEVYFQPKIALAEQRMAGLEALARWRLPAGGFVPPGDFVPLAERSGSIVAMTWLVFDKVIESLSSWRAGGSPSVAVNIAPQVLHHPEFFARLAKLQCGIESYGADLVVELTEESLVTAGVESAVRLERIRKLGVGLAIDDFGKGYSSLSYLKEIPATEVKIDKRFIETAGSDDKDRHIVSMIVELARAFEMSVVAEGVDSEHSLQTVAELGCDAAQGFFIAQPMKAGLVGEWMKTAKRESDRLGALLARAEPRAPH